MRIRRFFFGIIEISLLILIASCQNPQPGKSSGDTTAKQDSVVPKRDLTELVKNAGNSPYNNFALFIAGTRQTHENVYSKLEKDSVWIRHASNLKTKWDLMTSLRTAKLNVWAEKELPQPMRESEVLFYPFSGADILNANLLFPKTKAYYLFGLEPVGYLPDVLVNANGRDTLQRYFNSLNVSLNAITNYSFFRTNSMKVDFNASDLNGTIHLLLLFLSRNHNMIADIRYIYIDDKGLLQENKNRKVTENDGVEILFIDSSKQVHTATYFSVNLDNTHLAKNTGVQQFIKNLGVVNSYLKAASYLMYNASFSMIRTQILEQSKYLLQDDSGIPYHYFTDKDKWITTLYGVYVPPIQLFSNRFQKDLDSAYRDSTRVQKPLNFGIGYNFTRSNLMLFEKR